MFYRLTKPFIQALNWCGNAVIRMLGLPPPKEGAEAHSADELRLMMAESHRHGSISRAERELLENAFQFSDRTVRQVMRPRGEIAYLSLDRPLEENLTVAKGSEYTRFPLCSDDVDNVLGVVHVKDLLWPQVPLESSQDLVKLKRDILFIPEMIGIQALLSEMRRKKVMMAVAVDEYGVVSGLCTMEDILEELVGEIQDEFDQEHPTIRATKDGEFLVEGTVLIEDLNRHLMLNLHDSDNDTISGHLLSKLGRMAQVGETVVMDNYTVTLVEVKGLRISKLLFSPMAPKAPDRAPASAPIGGSPLPAT
jgi:CBS domain containing-hemolysin-like protein